MNNPVNNDAIYIKVMHNDGRFTFIDMNDIAQIGVGEEISFRGIQKNSNLEVKYMVAVISWKQPYTNQWQVFINKDSLEHWNKFCSNLVKDVDK